MINTKQSFERPSAWSLWAGVIAGPIFIITFFIEGATRRSGYNWLRHPVSSLSIGDSGWMQQLNFMVLGLLLLAFAVGLARAYNKPKVQNGVLCLWGWWLLAL